MLIEEPATRKVVPRQQAPVSSSAEPARRYTEAVSQRQPRVIDLIPTRWWTIPLLLVLLLASAAGIETLYGYVALGRTAFVISELPALDLSARGSIATWFSSTLLLTCAVYGLLIYQIRRHRVDDYRGRYRMWHWIVLLFLVASIDQVAGIQQSAWNAICQVAPLSQYPNAESIWAASLMMVTVMIGGRLLFETWGSRLSSLMLMVSLACFALVNASRMGWSLADAGVWRTVTLSSLTMGSHIALLMAVLLYGRHVYREARGQVRSAPKKRRMRRQARSEHSESTEAKVDAAPERSGASTGRRVGGKVVRADPPHTSRTKRSSGTGAPSSTTSSERNRQATRTEKPRGSAATHSGNGRTMPASCAPEDGAGDVGEQGARKLSKAERKRLRKQRRREQNL